MSQSAAFLAGKVFGLAHSNAVADAVHAVAELLKADKMLTLGTYNTLRGQWIKGYMAGMGCSEKSAQNRWAEVFKGVELAYGFKKPQSAEAAKKAMQRTQKKLSEGAGKTGAATQTGTASGDVMASLSAIGAAMQSATRGPDYSLPVQGEAQPAPQAPASGADAAADTLSALDRHLIAMFHSAQKSGDFTKLMDFIREQAASKAKAKA